LSQAKLNNLETVKDVNSQGERIYPLQTLCEQRGFLKFGPIFAHKLKIFRKLSN